MKRLKLTTCSLSLMQDKALAVRCLDRGFLLPSSCCCMTKLAPLQAEWRLPNHSQSSFFREVLRHSCGMALALMSALTAPTSMSLPKSLECGVPTMSAHPRSCYLDWFVSGYIFSVGPRRIPSSSISLSSTIIFPFVRQPCPLLHSGSAALLQAA